MLVLSHDVFTERSDTVMPCPDIQQPRGRFPLRSNSRQGCQSARGLLIRLPIAFAQARLALGRSPRYSEAA